jgi:hypothetical protein
VASPLTETREDPALSSERRVRGFGLGVDRSIGVASLEADGVGVQILVMSKFLTGV